MKKLLLALGVLIIIGVITIIFFFKSDTKNPYSETWGKFSGTCSASDMPDSDFGKDFHGCNYSVPQEEIPVFDQISLNWNNKFDNKKSLPIMGSAVIDVNNDGIDEVFLAGGVTQQDGLLEYKKGGFVTSSFSLPKKPENTTTFGAVSFDLDADGKIDLILTGDYGVLWYRNTG